MSIPADLHLDPPGPCLALDFDAATRRTDYTTTNKESTVMNVRTLVDRVRGEFNEMPGLQLTVPQAARLLGIEPNACRDVIDTLVASSFLRWTPAGMISRAER